ncbi:hypothetical protein SMACR_01419 [Sordaria macrospora]|uniref:WGS project CABT00000000 data, contig 2.4 n=2 Tax=Sordaria macrospora TaxID=5147 RepID=F7VQS2_SORMK|nr:uncharacterized protein SMAC_01419 [Sordaria macrospora k-hell]KAA8633064.1 hypothetical protein SMACR_01419 [Sordaria macrospora]KAH7634508.1 hypothetical protein B0T09DRAFT_6803 [Sordaria sp. MPI-SDFR-AT-0083]WPJ58701.1 hypothetical protein SMAC4_01419 [Sordaria macrospora]CCC07854.1 unnamed protein product [Sordaria macrospora k-hell]
MAGKPVAGRPKTTIEVPLSSIKKYTRGSGPPPPPITLAPPRDSTAYIIDQFVLPAPKDTKPDSRRRIFYHIGFTDIPAARLLVPCDEALQYVSPREVEEFEYEALEIKEAEKAIEAEKKRKGQGQAPVKKKTGRPPKARLNDPALDAPAEPVISMQEGDVLLAKQEAVGGPSLATPQKRKRAEIPRFDDSDEAAIRFQLQNESAAASEVEDSGTDLEGYDSADPLADDVGHRMSSFSRAGSSVSAQQPVAGPSKPTVISLGDKSKVTARPSSSVASTPGRIHPMFARSIEAGRSSVSGHGTQKWAGQNGVGHSLGFGGKTEAIARASPSRDSTRQFKAVPKTAVHPLPHPAHVKPISFTPLAVPIAVSKPLVTSDSLSKQNESSSARKRRKDEQSKPNKKQKNKLQIDEPVASWVVKELLDDQWVTEFGVKVHKYLVLWEGEWPPDQNPTWEPEDNIEDQSLIKKYLKKKQAGVLKPPKKTQRSMLSYFSQPQYSSVAEAFEGDIDELQPEAAVVTPDSDSDDGGDELLVTEEPVVKNGKEKISSFTSFDSKLEQYQKSFSRP